MDKDTEFYAKMAQAILSMDDEPVKSLFGPFANRIDAHRGSFITGAQNAIVSAYPVVARLVGDEYMRAMAQAFVRKSPPKLASLTLYGDDFPAFLREFAPVQKDLPWLSAVAELDRAWFAAYAAKDDEVLRIGDDRHGIDLALLAPGLVASVQLLRFKIPAYSIWRTNKVDENVQAVHMQKGAEWAVLWRQDNQIFHAGISRAEYVFLNNIGGGLSFVQSFAECVRYDQDFDLQQQFLRWLSAGLFMELKP